MKAQAAKEQEAKGQLSQAYAAAQNEMDALKQAVEDEHAAKGKVSKQLTEAITETANWRSKYEALKIKSGN